MSCGSKKDPSKIYFENAAAYSDFITQEQVSTIDAVNMYIYAINTGNIDSMQITLRNLQEKVSLSKASISKLADYKGDTLYRGAAIRFFSFIDNASKNELKQMGDLAAKDTSITTEEIALISQLSTEYTLQEKIHNDEIIKAQDEFAKKFGLSYK